MFKSQLCESFERAGEAIDCIVILGVVVAPWQMWSNRNVSSWSFEVRCCFAAQRQVKDSTLMIRYRCADLQQPACGSMTERSYIPSIIFIIISNRDV